ncbi:MAG TPA: DNA-directed RNA polymerase subunit omega [Sumerlaeia bacterium]|nr:DNA-directed RNA polymerase subunit omega [Sumerlaeia bacterium]
MKHDVRMLLETHRGKFLLVNSLARRIRALQSGHKALVPRRSDDLITVAQEEFRQGKVVVATYADGQEGDGSPSAAEETEEAQAK